jgi:hypothetical protein
VVRHFRGSTNEVRLLFLSWHSQISSRIGCLAARFALVAISITFVAAQASRYNTAQLLFLSPFAIGVRRGLKRNRGSKSRRAAKVALSIRAVHIMRVARADANELGDRVNINDSSSSDSSSEASVVVKLQCSLKATRRHAHAEPCSQRRSEGGFKDSARIIIN